MTFESRFLAKFRSVEDFPDPLPLQRKTNNVIYNYDNDESNNNNNNNSKSNNNNNNRKINSKNSNNNSSNTVKSDKSEKKGDSKNGVIKRRKSFTEKLFKNASGGTLRLTGINTSKLRDIFFGDKFANKASIPDDVFCNGLELPSEEIYSSPCSLPPNIGCSPDYENVDYFIPVSTSSSVISLPKHNGLKSPNASRLRTFRRTDSPYGTILKEKLSRSRLHLTESHYSDVDSIYTSSPFSYTVPLCSALNSSINSVTPPVITSKNEADSSSCNRSSSKSPLFKVENSLRETFNYVKTKSKKIERNASFTHNLSTEIKTSFYDSIRSSDSFSSFSSENSVENEITIVENQTPSNDIYSHLHKELKLKFGELKRKSDSNIPKISVDYCNGHSNEKQNEYLANVKTGNLVKDGGESSICKHSSNTELKTSHSLRIADKLKETNTSIENSNSSQNSNGTLNQSHELSYTSSNLELNHLNHIRSGFKKESLMQNTYSKPEVNGIQNSYNKPEANGMQNTYPKPEVNGIENIYSKPEVNGMQNSYPKPEVNSMQNTYSKSEVNGMQNTYSKPEVNGMKNTYSKPEVNGIKNTYSKPEVNGMQNTYSKPEVNGIQNTYHKLELNGIKNTNLKPEAKRMQKYFSTENLPKSDGSVYELNRVKIVNSSKTLNDFHKELMQKCTTLKGKNSNLSRNELSESEQLRNENQFSCEDKHVASKPDISPKPRLTRKPDIYSCPLKSKLCEENSVNESEIAKDTNNRPGKPVKPPHLFEIDQGKAKLQKIEINNNSIIISDQSPRKTEAYFSLKKKEKPDFRHLSNLTLRQNNKKLNIYSNIEETMSSHISLTNLSNLQKSDSYNTLKVKDLVATFNKCTVPSNGILTKDINRSYLSNGSTQLPQKKSMSEYNLTQVKRRSSYK